jgi:hypothetical protein
VREAGDVAERLLGAGHLKGSSAVNGTPPKGNLMSNPIFTPSQTM